MRSVTAMWRHFTFYPDLPRARAARIFGDLAVIGLIVAFVWVGMTMYHLVAGLAVLGTGIASAGLSIEGGFDAVSEAAAQIPLLGPAIASAFVEAGQATGAPLTAFGTQIEQTVLLLARAVGIVTAALPIIVLLVAVVPRRVRGIREMSAARMTSATVLADPERMQMLAMRAAFGLPFRDLVRFSTDPFGDLAAGRYDGLVSAALADVGLRPRSPREIDIRA